MSVTSTSCQPQHYDSPHPTPPSATFFPLTALQPAVGNLPVRSEGGASSREIVKKGGA
ncbi:hypothetical protein BDY24DRAFT_412257 [Mrakia frigida]|uniref:uncharacterized protein n=1 Tax=Mrakia frigida TaxID=29902 RepID=UPI003FCC193F